MANAFVTNGGFLKLYWSFNGEIGVNVLGVRIPPGVSSITQATADTVGAAVKAAYTANLASRQPTTTQLARVGLRDYRSANLPEFREAAPAAVGTLPTTDALPRGAALVVTLRTALSGKSFRGRVYLGGWSEADNDANGAQVTAAATAGVAFVNAVGDALEASGMFLAVLSRPSDRKVLTRTTFHPDGTSTVDTLSDESARVGGVTDVTVVEARNSIWEYQRRRDNRRGTGIIAALSSVASVTR